MDDRNIKTRLAELHQNPLAAYSTQQLKEELARRRRSHAGLRFRVKLQLFHKRRKMFYKR